MPERADIDALLRALQPALAPGRYAFITLPPGVSVAPGEIVASVREPEGPTVVVREEIARELGLPVAFTARWITLTVHSELTAVGLTAAFATALARAGIACNVVAGVHHDHLFVPAADAEHAMDVLRELQRGTAGEPAERPAR